MSEAPVPELEQELRELTTWTGPTPGLWRRALSASSQRTATPIRLSRFLTQRLNTWMLAVPAAAVLFVALVIWMNQPVHPFAQVKETGVADRMDKPLTRGSPLSLGQEVLRESEETVERRSNGSLRAQPLPLRLHPGG